MLVFWYLLFVFDIFNLINNYFFTLNIIIIITNIAK